MVFGFFGKKDQADQEEEEDIEPVSFLGPVNGQEVNLKANGRLVEASSILEMRLRPERLYGQIDAFLDEVWGPRVRVVKRRPAAGRAVAAARSRQRG